MRATIDGWRLAPSVGDGVVHSGAKPTVKVSASPEVVWNGNPYCDPSCVLYLPGYPGSGATIFDFSGQGNDGTITGATWAKLNGLWYQDYDGTDDHADLGDAASLQFTGAVTLEAWIDTTKNTNYGIVLDKMDGTTDGWSMTLDSGVVIFSTGLPYDGYNSGKDVSDGNLHQIFLSYDGATKFIMVDGVVIVTKAFSDATTNSDDQACLAARQSLKASGATYRHDGGIYLPRVYNTGLSVGVGQSHYNQERQLFGI